MTTEHAGGDLVLERVGPEYPAGTAVAGEMPDILRPPVVATALHSSAGGELGEVFGSKVPPCEEQAVRVVISTEAQLFAREHGGVLYVHTYAPRTCAECALLEVGTVPPSDLTGYERVAVAEDVSVMFRPRQAASPPGELSIELRGRRRPGLRAYWDGCIYAP